MCVLMRDLAIGRAQRTPRSIYAHCGGLHQLSAIPRFGSPYICFALRWKVACHLACDYRTVRRATRHFCADFQRYKSHSMSRVRVHILRLCPRYFSTLAHCVQMDRAPQIFNSNAGLSDDGVYISARSTDTQKTTAYNLHVVFA